MKYHKLAITLFIITCTFFSTIILAQTIGPAGVGNSDGSSGQPRNILWLDAGTLTSVGDGNDVSSWTDQSGNNLPFQPSSSGSNTDGSDPGVPSFVLDGGTATNNLPVVRFDGSNSERLILSSFNLMPTDAITTIIVTREASIESTGSGIVSYAVSGSSNEYLILNSSAGVLGTFVNGNNRGTGDLTSANARIFSTRWQNNGRLIHNLDTDVEYNEINSSAVSMTSGGVLALGGEQDGVDDDYATNQDLDGDIAEFIIFNEFLSNADRLIIENYLSHKYNITIADDFFGNDANYDSSYDEDIRGIGSDGTDTRTNSMNSGALTIREDASSLDTDEYVMLAHSGTAHADGVTTNRADAVNITDRWARDWYVEVNQGGGVAGVDGGDVNVEMVFDFGEAGLTYSGALSDYVLLYRSTSGGDFDRVFADSYVLEGGNQVVVSVSASRLNTGYYTLGTGNPLIAQTWYVFQDGNWSDASTWTTDASTAPIFNNPSNETPVAADEVIIRSGRTVTIQSGTDNLEVNQIKVDGTLDVTTTTGHNFNTINGTGVIRIAGNNPGGGLVDNFPGGTVTGNIGFADADNGGTVVIDAAGNITLNQPRAFKNLRIELDNNTDEAILSADITLNGDFEVRNGGFQFGDGTTNARTFTVFGDALVTNNGSTRIGSISTSTADARHSFTLYGDFTNQGQVRFTNRADFASDADRRNPNNAYYTSEATNGIVDVTFTSDNTNQTVDCNGITNFYRIVIDKGVDDTYLLSLQASSEDNFRLLGFANDNVNSDQQSATENTNAFALINGTADIRPNVEIPVLNRTGNYSISSTARLWIDGGDVRKTNATAIVPYGTVQVSGGYLEATGGSGLTIRENGLVRIEGGEVVTSQIRTSVAGPGSLGGYSQTGGEVTVDGSLGGGAGGNHYVFSLPYTGNIFLMSGGNLTVRNPNSRGSIFINSDPANINVTGGTVIVESSNANNATITSRAPFYNVRMRASGASVGTIELDGGESGDGTGGVRTIAAQPLIVKNDLIVHGHNDTYYDNPLGNFPVTFSAVNSDTTAAVDSDAAVSDVYIGGSLYVGRNSLYQCLFGGIADYDDNPPTYYNTTYFNQTAATSAIDTIYWGRTGSGIGQLELGNFVLDRTTGNELRAIARDGNSGNIRFDINGDVSVLSGTLDQNAYTIRTWGDITNNDRLGTYYNSGPYPTASGTPSVAQIRFREGSVPTFTTSDNATFGNIRFNVSGGENAEFSTDVYIERMEYRNGHIYVKGNTLTVDEIWNINNGGRAYFNDDVANSSIVRLDDTGVIGNILVFTDGNASDGGLRLKVGSNTVAEDETSRINNTGPITFPVGFTPDGGTTLISRPAQLKVKDVADDGYVQINVVSGELQTTDLSGGEILQHYWRVQHDSFTALPTVALRFYYRNQSGVTGRDLLAGASSENDYVPGYVLDGGTYTRYFESDPAEDNSDIAASPYTADDQSNTRLITFNGVDTNQEFDQADFTGFELVEANFTAGVSSRFIGSPTVYYSRVANGSWGTNSTWSTVGYGGAAASSTPGAGDIVNIGYAGSPGSYQRHRVNLNVGTTATPLEIAELILEQNPEANGVEGNNSRLIITPTRGLQVNGRVAGDGEIQFQISNTSTPTLNADLGEFARTEGASFIMRSNSGNVTAPTNLTEFPRLSVPGASANYDDSRSVTFATDISCKNLNVRFGGTILMSNGSAGNIYVEDSLRIGGIGSDNEGRIIFQNTGNARAITVGGDVILDTDGAVDANQLYVETGGTANINHQLNVGGNIELRDDDSLLDLFTIDDGNESNITLNLIGDSSTVFNSNATVDPDLYRVVMNKNHQDSTMSINTNFTLGANTNGATKAIELQRGTLVLNNSGINVDLTTGGGDFQIPSTTGLRVTQGTVNVSGDDTGILLDGALVIDGGIVNMDDPVGNGNNYIEYSSSGNARLEISDGTLTVGSQIRRSLTSTTGVLQYSQTGGTVVIGKNAAPESDRGLLEVTNAGSSFEHTAGSLTIVRDNNSTTIPSLLLQPETDNITDGTVITIGNGNTPANQDRFGIQSNITLSEIELASSNISAELYNLPLVTNILDISTGVAFDANGFDLTINENLNNNGTFATSGNPTNSQFTYFPTSSSATITGGGTTNFWNFEKSGSGTLALSKDITVENNAFIYAGTLSTQTSAFNIEKDLVHDATHTSDAAGPGIVFNGSQQQNLDRSGAGTSVFGVIELDNASGLIIADTEENFQINGKLVLNTGVFDVGGNLIELSTSAVIENSSGGTSVNDFNVNNMIQTNSAIRDFGVRKFFNAVSSGSVSFTYPVGLVGYTPAVITINDMSAGSITVRPVRDVPPIAEDTENNPPVCNDPNISDADNVLQYYWIVKSNGISGFSGDLTTYYDPNDVRITNAGGSSYTIANYGPARLYNTDDTWDKVFSTADFDEGNQRISYPFTNQSDATLEGIYTAGITLRNDGTSLLCGAAIPDQVPQFFTDNAGGGNFFDNGTYQGGVAPIGGETPDVIIQDGDELIYNQNSIRTRRITIQSGGTLIIQNGTNNHNLGFVTGEGTIRLESNGISISFPTGDYEDFFPDGTCSGGGGLEYAGSGSYAVLTDLPNIRRVIFSGSGSRTLPNNFTLNVCEDFDIRGTTNLVIPDGNSTVIVRGNVYKSDASAFDNGGGNSHITMAGSSPQIISGDFTGSDAFNELEINNAAGVTVINAADVTRSISANQTIEVEGQLDLTNGQITTNANNPLRILASVGATTSGGSAASFVNGPLQAVLNDNQSFTFPVGKSSRLGQITVNDATHTGQTLTWQAEYFNSNAEDDGQVTSLTATSDPSIQSISRREYWIVTDDAGTAPLGSVSAAIGLSWDTNSDPPADVSTLVAMVWDNVDSEWDNYGGTNHSGNGSGGTFVNTTIPASYVPFSTKIITMGSSEPSTLPVEFLEFTAEAQRFSVLLKWKTASEENNDFFEVQRSKDGESWEKIGIVDGAGNSSSIVSYSYKDENPLVGTIYYRLRQVDFDGKFDYSKITSVEVDGYPALNTSVLDIRVFPNPTPGVVTLQVEGLPYGAMVTVKLLDIFGNAQEVAEISSGKLVGGIKLNQQGQLPSGLYFVDIQQGNVNLQRKVIIR
ncbi:MAG: T9SS type A sorting domain-containing protein [Bacteroidota bacterium]